MNEKEMRILCAEYKTASQQRRDDIFYLFIQQFKKALSLIAKNQKDNNQEALIQMHLVLEEWTPDSDYPLIKTIFNRMSWKIKKYIQKEYTAYYYRNQAWDFSFFDFPQPENEPTEIPKVSKELYDYFSGFTLEKIAGNRNFKRHAEIRNNILNEINELRKKTELNPFRDFSKIRYLVHSDSKNRNYARRWNWANRDKIRTYNLMNHPKPKTEAGKKKLKEKWLKWEEFQKLKEQS